jgi:hypothetical protein
VCGLCIAYFLLRGCINRESRLPTDKLFGRCGPVPLLVVWMESSVFGGSFLRRMCATRPGIEIGSKDFFPRLIGSESCRLVDV